MSKLLIVDVEILDLQVSRLRREIEPDSKRPDIIRSGRNGGYNSPLM
ncbi:hypothetical protein AABC73_17315 [Pseudomonas sp. G.S.17]